MLQDNPTAQKNIPQITGCKIVGHWNNDLADTFEIEAENISKVIKKLAQAENERNKTAN